MTTRTRGFTMRRISAAAAIGIAVFSLTACGSPPKDADKDDFCKAMNADGDDAIEKAKDVGTPKEISGDAREGFEIALDLADDAGDDESKFEKAYNDLSDGDQKKVEAFFEKAGEVCGE